MRISCLNGAESMKWKGVSPVVRLNHKVCHKGVSVSKKAMWKVEARSERNPLLAKWDILIRPV
ncbi:Uncharacterized protein dnm_086280 [Desulfonema magnum]|uniref:Uncharacterized protein n=2 Tax=Desulfonema magnum TaxID=45655 RepID=A0A975BWQ7_9BACT|nr:Uncharacterized protein dnm_086280 [Desulfonema magnum]